MFVERRAGVVVGVYANRQPGYAIEELPANNAEIVAYLAPKPKPPLDPSLSPLPGVTPVTRAEFEALKALLATKL